MKVIEERLRNAQEKVQKAAKNINMLPPYEHMVAILVNKHSYNKIEELREEQKTRTQRLVPLQDEALTVIGALAVAQVTMKKVAQYNEEKLLTMTVQLVEEILENESEVKKKVATVRETLQKFMEAWKGTTQQD